MAGKHRAKKPATGRHRASGGGWSPSVYSRPIIGWRVPLHLRYRRRRPFP